MNSSVCNLVLGYSQNHYPGKSLMTGALKQIKLATSSFGKDESSLYNYHAYVVVSLSYDSCCILLSLLQPGIENENTN